jgi:hypothetical protein
VKRKTGTREWASENANCFVGCEHDCRYCYAREMAIRFSKARWKKATDLQKFGDVPLLRVTRENWSRPRLSLTAVSKSGTRCAPPWRKRPGVIMFPSTHDVTPGTSEDCINFLLNILRAGNSVVFVSKPHSAVIEALLHRIAPQAGELYGRLLFRFTITASDDRILKYWEPGAPPFADRMKALIMVHSAGWRTSVSIEPMLDTDTIVRLVGKVRPFVQEDIWLGKMNNIRRRVHIENDLDREQVKVIEQGQTDERIMEIVRALKDDPLIRWKDSIQEVIARHQPSV